MIEKLEVQNFQAHKALDIEFDKRVTTIVGPSDVGKSAVIRALKWAFTNSPSGMAFVKEGSKAASVIINIDGRKVLKTRGKSVNLYSLDKKDFHAFGSNVPDTLKNFLKVGDVNFQDQHDAPFWLSESAPEVSRQLNQIINLGVIDTSLSNIASVLRSAKSSFEVSEKSLDEAEADKKRLRYVVRMDKQLKAIENLNETKANYMNAKLELGGSLELLTQTKQKTDTARNCADAGIELITLYGIWHGVDHKAQDLYNLITSIEEAEDDSFSAPDISYLETHFNSFVHTQKKVGELSDLIFRLEMADNHAKKTKRDLDRVENQFHKQTKGKSCPVCGNKM